MEFSADVQKALDEKAADLQATIDSCKKAVAEAQARQSRAEEQLAAIKVLQADRNVSGTTEKLEITAPQASVKKSLTDLGFRDAMRVVLSDTNEGLRPKDIYKTLEKAGFTLSGNTDMKTRVYNELFRMNKNGLLRKTDTGKYKLPPDFDASNILEG